VLVPVHYPPFIPGRETLEWASFDPLLTYLASQYGIELPPAIIPTSSDNQTITIRPDYNLEKKGLGFAFAEELAMKQNGTYDPIFERCITNFTALYDPSGPPYSLPHNQYVTLSVRLISYPSFATWLPYQNANISFYLGIWGENSTGIEIGNDTTNSTGVASIRFKVDILKYGIRTVYFYAEVDWGVQGILTRAAVSFPYNLVFS
jgi:hypothetical protein